MTARCCLFLVVLMPALVSSPAHAVIRRHDRDDTRYLERGARYPAVVRLGGGTATLIDARWLITAAHVARNLSPFDAVVRINGASYRIDGIVHHPDAERPPRQQTVDLALIRLAGPVKDITPVSLHDQQNEADMAVVFVGPGMFGDGRTGPQGDDGKMRAATNTVARVIDNYIVFKFDAPPDATDLEGISGPGDSGGPALVERDGSLFIIGVSSANDDEGAAGPCRYHSTEYYARVSTAAAWCRTTISANDPPPLPFSETIDLRSGHWPDSPAARVAAAFFDAYAGGTDDDMQVFETTWRAEAALAQRPVADRVQSWRKFRAEWGGLTAHRCSAEGTDAIHVLVFAEGERVWKAFRFGCEPHEPHKLIGIGIDSPVAGK